MSDRPTPGHDDPTEELAENVRLYEAVTLVRGIIETSSKQRPNYLAKRIVAALRDADWLSSEHAQDPVDCGELGQARDQLELLLTAVCPLVPVQGSWGGYRIADTIDPVLHASHEEWAAAAYQFCEAHGWLIGSETMAAGPEGEAPNQDPAVDWRARSQGLEKVVRDYLNEQDTSTPAGMCYANAASEILARCDALGLPDEEGEERCPKCGDPPEHVRCFDPECPTEANPSPNVSEVG